MPLFMALSGALFRITWLKGKYKSLFDVIVDKGKRLMIPFFIVSICYSFPIKLLTGYYSTSDNVIVDFIVGQLFVQGNTHLWYLPALFFIFLIAFILEKYVAKHNIGKLFVILIAYLISSKVSWQLLSYVLEYLLWFYAGYFFEVNRERVNDKINIGTTICVYLVGVAFYVFYRKLDAYNFLILNELLKIITVISLCLCVYVCAYGISKLRITETRIFKRLNNDSFGIYLYSDPLNYVILFAGAYLFGNTLYSSNVSVLLLFIMRFFGTLIFSVIVTFFVRKIRLKYLC